MEAEILLSSKNLRKYNFIRYKGIPPSPELIDKVVKKSGLKFFSKFEMVWALPERSLTKAKNELIPLAPKYWHIFYDFDAVRQMYTAEVKKTKQVNEKSTLLQSNKNLIDGLRNR